MYNNYQWTIKLKENLEENYKKPQCGKIEQHPLLQIYNS